MTAKKPNKKRTWWTLERVFPFILIIAGAFALLASVMIMHEKLAVLQDPNHIAICDVNPILSCGSVMDSKAAEVFGFQNTYLGLIGFPVVITIGMAMLAGATFKRWFWQATQIGMTLTLAFILWLMYHSVFTINALCMFCMILWASVIPAFWYTTVYNLRNGNIFIPSKLKAANSFIQKHHLDILISIVLIIVGYILYRFWYYFGTLI